MDSFNDLSAAKLAVTLTTFKAHTNLLIQAKTDLDSVYRRIRSASSQARLLPPSTPSSLLSLVSLLGVVTRFASNLVNGS